MSETYYIMEDEYKPSKNTDPKFMATVEDHLETYKNYFDEWNSKKPYVPSFLFGGIGKIMRWLQIYDLDENEILKMVLGTAFGLVALVVILTLIFI